MAATLTLRSRFRRCAWMLLLCAAASAVSAEDLPDPTKPPAELRSSGRTVANSLESIMISSTHRAAIINGQMLELGAKLGDVRLIEVNQGGVVLEGVHGRQALSLFPGIKITREAAGMRMEDKAKGSPPGLPAGQVGKKEEK